MNHAPHRAAAGAAVVVAALACPATALAQAAAASTVEAYCGTGEEAALERAATQLDVVASHVPEVPAKDREFFADVEARAMRSVVETPAGKPSQAGAILRAAQGKPMFAAWQLHKAIADARAAINDAIAPAGVKTYPTNPAAEQVLRANRAHARIETYLQQVDAYLGAPSTRKRPAAELEELRLAAIDPTPALLDYANCKLARAVAASTK
jgi:hypothetical protein